MSKLSTPKRLGLYAIGIVVIALVLPLLIHGGAFAYVLVVGLLLGVLWFIYKRDKARRLAARQAEKVAAERDAYERQLGQKVGHRPVRATVLGGSGTDLMAGQEILLCCTKDRIVFTDAVSRKHQAIALGDLMSVEVSGPGTQVTDAGLVGGGFGLTGAVKGMLTAAVINKLTERASTNTFVRVATPTSEAHFHIGDREPAEIRMILSPAIIRVEAAKHLAAASPGSGSRVASELSGLHKLMQDGALTEEEFASAKKRLLGNS